MIKVSKTQVMYNLLSSILVTPSEMTILPDKIQLNINMQQLMYRFCSTESDIQYVYGSSSEWKELHKLIFGDGK
jgi:hypothetical protein